MQKVLITILTFLLYGTLTAQTNYYTTTKTFYEDGYVYQCDLDESGMITLYNKDNRFTYTHYANRDDTRVSSDILLGKVQLIEDDNWTRRKCSEIANNVFSATEREKVASEEYDVNMIVDTSTGIVIEVFFCFLSDDPFSEIPVTTFRKLEMELKEKIWFTISPEGKKLQFLRIGWMQEVSPTPQPVKPELL